MTAKSPSEVVNNKVMFGVKKCTDQTIHLYKKCNLGKHIHDLNTHIHDLNTHIHDLNTHIHDLSHSWLGTGSSINFGYKFETT
jgi:hypothetical protein